MSILLLPDPSEAQSFTDATEAVDRLNVLYDEATAHLISQFREALITGRPAHRIRAYYPEIRLVVDSFSNVDTRLSFGHVARPGTYSTTVTRPDLFRNYLIQQIGLLIRNHGVPVTIGPSVTPIPLHFAVAGQPDLIIPQAGALDFPLRDVFDVPDLATTK